METRPAVRRDSGTGKSRGGPFAIVGVTATLLLGVYGCGGGDAPFEPDPDPDPDPDPTGATYSERVAAAWTSFTAGAYSTARSGFAGAVTLDPAPAAAYAGLGWSELKLDQLEPAHQAFADGSTRTGTDAVLADLFAGWAFAWSARSAATDHHAESNSRVLQAEALEPGWVFDYVDGLDADDLALLAAGNFFALGEFASSLVRVQTLDPSFDPDVSTADGQADLAEKIEMLRTGG